MFPRPPGNAPFIFCCLHRKIRVKDVITWQVDFGSLKHCITYDEACTTALIRTSLPAGDRNFSFQQLNFLYTLSCIYRGTTLPVVPSHEREPKIFSMTISQIYPEHPAHLLFPANLYPMAAIEAGFLKVNELTPCPCIIIHHVF